MLQGIRDECPQVDNKRLEVIEWCQQKEAEGGATLGHGGARTLTLGTQEHFYPTLGTLEVFPHTLSFLRSSHPTLGIREAYHAKLSSWEACHPTLSYQGDWCPMMRTREVRIVVVRCYDDRNPSLSLREAAFLSWRFQEMEDEVVSCLTLAVRSLRVFERSLGEILLHEWSLVSTCFSLTIIFPRFLQVHISLGVHAIPWLERILTEHLLRSDNYTKPESL